MIHVERLTKYFGPVLAVNNVSFDVEPNEIVGLLGNNGAGKSTLMRILTTYLSASSGVARVGGFDVMNESMEVRRRIGYLPESIPLYPEMRVSEYLEFRAKLKGVDRKARPQRLDHCIDICRIREVQRRLLGTLSKGYRQRVGLADAMINDPPILILDEPTDGLDPGQKHETLNMLKELGNNHTIMLSSHLLTEVETLVQRVLIMRRGVVALAKKLTELESEPIIDVEVRGPVDQVTSLLQSMEGVSNVQVERLEAGLAAYQVRTQATHDLREAISQRLSSNGHVLRRLDRRRRRLQDRWNEINNMDESLLLATDGPPGPAAQPPASPSAPASDTAGSTAITTG